MLPLHGQGTAAVKLSSLGRIYLLFLLSKGNVFGKQSGPGFAEFLLYMLIYKGCELNRY